MKTYWVFWTFEANYAAGPCRVQAKTIVRAMGLGTTYDPYAEQGGKRIRFIVFEEGGTLVWDGPAPLLTDSPGNVVEGRYIPSDATMLGERSEHENDLQWLEEVHITGSQQTLPDHLVPFLQRVKTAYIVGNEDAPDAIYLSEKVRPTVDDTFYRFS
jgi:hypothetical protein